MGLRLTRRRVVGALIVALIIGGTAGAVAMRAAKKGSDGPDPKAATTLEFGARELAAVEAKSMPRWLPVSGTMQPVNQATVKAKVSGDVRQITVREGDAVQAGQMLVRVDTADLDARVLERQGQLQSAKAQLALAEKTNAMNQKLLKQNFISQNASDSSQSSLEVAKGNVLAAEAQLRVAQNALRDSVATAPLSGIVAKRHVQPGEKVAFDSPLVTVVDLKAMELQALVPSGDIPELKPGMTVDLAVDGFTDRKFTGRIERINPSTEAGTRAILVFVGIPNPELALRGGMFATGRIALAAGAPVPTLPSTAVRTEAGQSYVWTIQDGKLAKRTVLIGRRDDDAGRVELKTALPANVPVLAAKFDNLKEGAPALVRAADEAPAKKAS
ncbi:MAG TPA: efflux RND transporter periplasmic adaptor subunit [Casimicrobiaceae bacterium]|nr:efflux RND transporter periplasmic adaptor subunit [Casimicrobiaceae bacterium]